MDKVRIDLVYVPEQGERPLRICGVQDKELAITIGRKAVSEIREQAKSLRNVDPILSAVQNKEAERLQQVLQMVGIETLEPI